MLQFIKITTTSDPYFAQMWNLYQESFPECERRDAEYLKATLNRDLFSFEAIVDDGVFIGLIAWWQLGQVLYVEHLATITKLRGRGYGTTILNYLIAKKPHRIILEVEPPLCPLSRRRVEFYQRSGFHLNGYDYLQPSYSADQSQSVSLMLMSYPVLLTCDEFEAFKAECYSQVHFLRRG